MNDSKPTQSIPAHAGIGLRAPHIEQVIHTLPSVPWFEVHSENYFVPGGETMRQLAAVREHYPISLHGVGLSLGSADRPARSHATHLSQLKTLIDDVQPGLVSEHISWGAAGSFHLNALLPLPYTDEALAVMIEHVDAVQSCLQRQILVENASTYLEYAHSTMPEWEFVTELVRRSGCGLLLDVNNIYVNSVNHGFDPLLFIDAVDADTVGELHLAGFSRKEGLAVPLLIDSHDHPVYPEVWDLYRYTVQRMGRKPTLIEWDAHIPELSVLQLEAAKAEEVMHAYSTVTC